MKNVQATVQSMLNDKPTPFSVYENTLGTKEDGENEDGGPSDERAVCVDVVPAPFPFKIAKALDQNIYRNIEYDTWIEVRKGEIIYCSLIVLLSY